MATTEKFSSAPPDSRLMKFSTFPAALPPVSNWSSACWFTPGTGTWANKR